MIPTPEIGVVDCNNFFVSCERVFRPDLQTVPVIVLSSNDGCVVARSQEVKDIGIPMGVPYFKIKDIIKDNKIHVFSSHFALYRDISRRVFEVLRDQIDIVEQYSIDEAFFKVPPNTDPQEIALEIRKTIEQVVGIPVSVGIGFSKTQAKAAVEIAKKQNGVQVWSIESWQAAASTTKLSSIWGVGAKLELKAKQHSLYTVEDWITADSTRLRSLFGVIGERLQLELSGVVVDIVGATKSVQQSIMSTRSFKSTTSDLAVLQDAVAYHTRHIAASLRAQNVGAWELSVSVRPSRHSDFVLQGGSKRAVFSSPTNDSIVMLRVANSLCKELFIAGVPYKKAGVVASRLESEPNSQQSLFTETEANSHDALLQVIDTINRKSGTETILVGSRLRAKEWGTKVDARSPAYTTRWSDLVKVKA